MSDNTDYTLAVFLLDGGDAARRLLDTVMKIDEGDENVKIVDAAVADHHTKGKVTVKQTHDVSGRKGGFRGGSIGVIAGAVMGGPPGAVVGGALGATLAGLYARLRDIGIEDSFMRKVAGDIDQGKSAVFVQYEGDWAASIGAISDAIRADQAELIHSTLPADKAEALQAFVAPAVDDLGGEETVTDYEVEVAAEPEATPAEESPAEESPAEEDAAPVEEPAPAEVPAPVAEPTPAAETPAPPPAPDEAAAKPDDLTQLAGIGPKAAEALTAAGITTYSALAATGEPAVREALYAAHILPRSNVATWAMQANYAAKGDWQGLAKYNQR
jgi:uncharacterized membrane protein/predicted flap endonuclease-1-like 5' DNA nuclease